MLPTTFSTFFKSLSCESVNLVSQSERILQFDWIEWLLHLQPQVARNTVANTTSAQLYFICTLCSFILWYHFVSFCGIILFHVVVVQINGVIVNMSSKGE